MRLLGNLRRGRAAGLNRPNRLVRNYDRGEFGFGQPGEAVGQLPFEHRFGLPGLAFRQGFPDADNSPETSAERGPNFLVDALVRLAEELASLGVPDQRVAASRFPDHRNGDGAGPG